MIIDKIKGIINIVLGILCIYIIHISIVVSPNYMDVTTPSFILICCAIGVFMSLIISGLVILNGIGLILFGEE